MITSSVCTRLKKYSETSGRKWSSSFRLYVACIAGSFQTSSTKGAYSRVAAGKNASRSPVAMISRSQSEKCFSLGFNVYTHCGVLIVPSSFASSPARTFQENQKLTKQEPIVLYSIRFHNRWCFEEFKVYDVLILVLLLLKTVWQMVFTIFWLLAKLV